MYGNNFWMAYLQSCSLPTSVTLISASGDPKFRDQVEKNKYLVTSTKIILPSCLHFAATSPSFA